jgi:hypothetical protein
MLRARLTKAFGSDVGAKAVKLVVTAFAGPVDLVDAEPFYK